MAVVYLLLTHGPKHFDLLRAHPAARQQLANLAWALAREDRSIDGKLVDYARSVSSLAALPILSRNLQKLKAGRAKGALLMDDMSRLFSICPDEKRLDLFRELQPYGEFLAGLRQHKRLAGMTPLETARMIEGYGAARYVLAKPPRKPRTLVKRRRQTRNAIAASQAARAQAADEKAKQLAAIRDDLQKAGTRVTNAAIAAEANRRGIRTTRDGEWRRDTVARSLRRLEKVDEGA